MLRGDAQPRLLLVDDHEAILQKIKELLSSRFNLVGLVSDSSQAITMADQLCPDLIVLDISMPEPDGIRIARTLQRNGSKAKLLFLTVQNDPDYIDAAFAAGAGGYVLKSRMQADLIRAIDAVLEGGMFISARCERLDPDM